MTTCKNYRELYQRLKEELPSIFEAQQVFRFVTGKEYHQIPFLGDAPCLLGEWENSQELIQRRKQGEPLQYLLGEWEFYGLPFVVGKGVLIPRSDTETLVEVGLELLETTSGKEVLDLCAGSGCVGIALAHYGKAKVTALEYSAEAFPYLGKNIALNEVAVTPLLADVFSYTHSAPVDLIVSNPPYIPTRELPQLQTEVQQEPQMALDGGESGLDFYRFVVQHYYDMLKTGGWMAFEIGQGQEADVMALMEEQGFQFLQMRKDLGQIIRVVWGQKQA